MTNFNSTFHITLPSTINSYYYKERGGGGGGGGEVRVTASFSTFCAVSEYFRGLSWRAPEGNLLPESSALSNTVY